jgi:hypothetical protein
MAQAAAKEAMKGPTEKRKAKDRSPNFPAITFDAALGLAKKLWDIDKKHAMGLDLAFKRLGYTKNGRSMRVLSALKKYGLIVFEGTEVRVSDDANAIFIFPEGSPERESRIKSLAMLPLIFKEVLKRFPSGLPTDENLAAKLQHEMGFTEDAVGPFIKALRAAMATAGVDRLPGTADTEVEVITSEAATMPQTAAVPTAPARSIPVSAPQQAGAQPRAWNLGDDTWMHVAIPPRLTKRNVEKLRKYVDNLASEAAISWEDGDA